MLLDDSELARMPLLARTGEWSLYWRRQADRPPWTSLYVRRDVGRNQGQRTYWIGWNRTERRLSKSYDAQTLRRKFPGIHVWVEATCLATRFR